MCNCIDFASQTNLHPHKMYRIFALPLFLIGFSACKTFYKPVNRPNEATVALQAIGAQAGNAIHYPAQDEGQLTASGEPYQHNAFTAGHKTLPFGTMVYVVNEENGNRTQVRINDRLTDNNKDIILLSGAAAQQLDMITRGRAKVQVVQGEPQTAQPLAATPTRSVNPPPTYAAVQRPVVEGRVAQPDEQLNVYNQANIPVASSATVIYPPSTYPPVGGSRSSAAPVQPYPTQPQVTQPQTQPYPTQPPPPSYPAYQNPAYTAPPVVTPPVTSYPQTPPPTTYPSQPPSVAMLPPVTPTLYTVQAVVYGTKAKAEQAAQSLGGEAWIQEITSNGRKMFRVLYGQYPERANAEQAMRRVKGKFPEAFLKNMAEL
jgi:rare lipoprotein A (peptidoglycan hydrolase)